MHSENRGTIVLQQNVFILFSRGSVSEKFHSGLSLFGRYGNRKYLNAAERLRFLDAVKCAPPYAREFCATLGYSGARISEVLALTPLGVDLDNGAVNIRTLKRRRPNLVRQIPLPSHLLEELDHVFHIRELQRDNRQANERIWPFSRTTGWRYVKYVMAQAQISGMPAMPKGLRHGFGVNAFQANVPPHLVQRWLGHASLATTAIYCDVVGPDERDFAARMWAT
jgi:integrase